MPTVKLTKIQLTRCTAKLHRVNTIASQARTGAEIHCVNVMFSTLIAPLYGYFPRAHARSIRTYFRRVRHSERKKFPLVYLLESLKRISCNDSVCFCTPGACCTYSGTRKYDDIRKIFRVKLKLFKYHAIRRAIVCVRKFATKVLTIDSVGKFKAKLLILFNSPPGINRRI